MFLGPLRRVPFMLFASMLLGAHQSVAGGAWGAIARGRADGCEALQIFARPSAQWRAKPLDTEEVSLFRSEHATVGWPVMSHASYLINIAATDPVILEKSREALFDEMFRAEELGLDFVVLHPGAHLGAGPDDGIARGRGLPVRASRPDLRDARAPAAGDHRRPGELPRLPVRRDGSHPRREPAAATASASASIPATPTPPATTSAPKRATNGSSSASTGCSASIGCRRSTSTIRRPPPAAASIATPRSATATSACSRSGGW